MPVLPMNMRVQNGVGFSNRMRTVSGSIFSTLASR